MKMQQKAMNEISRSKWNAAIWKKKYVQYSIIMDIYNWNKMSDSFEFIP
jgi:hypothetical protein